MSTPSPGSARGSSADATAFPVLGDAELAALAGLGTRMPGHAWAGRPAPLAGALYTWRICASLSADDNRANERWNSEVAT